ncbi:pinin-like [Eupeodes corollae]|uniref:pinin-like n=1 Tax=Eupeodes corollae TaxID=290404 RepID=UPI00249073C6|nr:pinin-like [Eupeodes corollae]
MQISIFYLLITLTITSVAADVDSKKVDVRLPVHKPDESDDRNPENVNVLLTTLFEMHHNLLAQISVLEDKLKTSSLPTTEKSDIKHMVEHYTAQKNNIELSIQLIQSNEGLDMSRSRRRGGGENESSIETKSIPLFMNFFKRNRNPTSDQTNPNIGYSLAYPQPIYEVPSQPQVQTQPQAQSQSTPTFVYQAPSPISVPSQQANQQFVATSQPQYQAQYQPQYQPQPQFQVQSEPQQIVQVDQQYVPGPQVALYSQVQETLPESQYHRQPPQLNEQFPLEQQYLPQQQLDFETVFRPSNVPVRRPQVSESDTQRYQQQGSFGQKEGIFVYYPNGLITNDKERPTIANRVGQAFDRFGQVISNLGNWQLTANPTTETGLSSNATRLDSSSLSIKGSKVTNTKISSQKKPKKPIDDKKKPKLEGETKEEK